MPFGIMQHLNVAVCENADDAIKQGYKYEAPEYIPVKVDKVVIVKNGTVGGNSTVDLILEDETGQKYVTMITGRLLAALPV